MSCTSCLSNNDIQTPDQVSVQCTTPYFHKDTLTPPSSSRSPPLAGGGQVRMRPAMHLYITHALNFEIYTTLLEVIQLMSIAGYEAYVCVCFFMYKTLCAFIWLPWDTRSCLYVRYHRVKPLPPFSSSEPTFSWGDMDGETFSCALKEQYKMSRDK